MFCLDCSPCKRLSSKSSIEYRLLVNQNVPVRSFGMQRAHIITSGPLDLPIVLQTTRRTRQLSKRWPTMATPDERVDKTVNHFEFELHFMSIEQKKKVTPLKPLKWREKVIVQCCYLATLPDAETVEPPPPPMPPPLPFLHHWHLAPSSIVGPSTPFSVSKWEPKRRRRKFAGATAASTATAVNKIRLKICSSGDGKKSLWKKKKEKILITGAFTLLFVSVTQKKPWWQSIFLQRCLVFSSVCLTQ